MVAFFCPPPFLGGKVLEQEFAYLDVGGTSANLTEYTFNLPFGDEHPRRRLYAALGVHGPSSANRQFGTVSIGGVPATIVAGNTLDSSLVAIAVADVPTGASGDVVFTVPDGGGTGGAALYRAVDYAATPSDWVDSFSTPHDLTMDTPANCFVIANCIAETGAPSWSGITQDQDTTLQTGLRMTSASDTFVAAEAARAMSFSGSSGAGVVAAVFGPA